MGPRCKFLDFSTEVTMFLLFVLTPQCDVSFLPNRFCNRLPISLWWKRVPFTLSYFHHCEKTVYDQSHSRSSMEMYLSSWEIYNHQFIIHGDFSWMENIHTSFFLFQNYSVSWEGAAFARTTQMKKIFWQKGLQGISMHKILCAKIAHSIVVFFIWPVETYIPDLPILVYR